MAKAADTKDGARSIGLATEHRLPEAFKARTDADAGTVEIRRPTGRPLEVAINSFASVANALAVFSPDGDTSLKAEHTIRIVDDFTGKDVTITANTFVDVAAAFQVFIVENGRYLPSAVHAEAPKEPVAEKSAEPKARTAPAKTEPKKPTASASKGTSSRSAQGPAKEAPGKATKAAKPENEPDVKVAAAKRVASKETVGTKVDAPEWAKDLPLEYVDDSSSFRMEARSLALTKERAKTVEGIADGSSQFTAFGYEVLLGDKPGGKHAGWVIVEDPKSWVVTGFGDASPSKHANLNAAAIRIRITNLPRIA